MLWILKLHKPNNLECIMSNFRPVVEKSIKVISFPLSYYDTTSHTMAYCKYVFSIMKSLPKMKKFNQDLCFVMYITTDEDDKWWNVLKNYVPPFQSSEGGVQMNVDTIFSQLLNLRGYTGNTMFQINIKNCFLFDSYRFNSEFISTFQDDP